MALREQAKRGGEPVIMPLRDKNSGKVLTNVQIIRNMDRVLTALKNSPVEQDQIDFSKMTNNDPTIYAYIHEVAAIENDFEAQKRIEETLLPNPSMAQKLQQFEAGAMKSTKGKK